MSNDASKPKIIGNVDRFVAGRHIGGWVVDEDDRARSDIQVELRIDRKIVATTIAKLVRGDGYHGFQIPHEDPNLASYLVSGRAALTVDGDEKPQELHFHGPMLEAARQFLASQSLKPDAEAQAITAEDLSALSSADEVSSLLVPAGFESPDGSAIMGRDGYVFLYRGSNDVRSMYDFDETSPSVIRSAQRWVDLFQSRSKRLSESGTPYLQMVIPEKNSVLMEQAPPDIRSATPVFRTVERLMEAAANSYYLSLLKTLREVESGAPFLRTDSHLSTIGCRAIMVNVLDRISEYFPPERDKIDNLREEIAGFKRIEKPLIFSGDLADRFGFKVHESVNALDTSMLALRGQKIETTAVHIRPDNGHTGTHIVWRNPDAPIQLKVIAFANSFFERGTAPRGLSWWFNHIFSEFHFIWSGDFDYDYVSLQMPDFVLCQTIERFLNVVPKT